MHTLDELIQRLDSESLDVSKFVMDCRYFVIIKGENHPERDLLEIALLEVVGKILTHKQFEAIFTEIAPGPLTGHFKNQRKNETTRDDFQKLIHQKPKNLKDVFSMDSVHETEMTPITPSSPRFLMFYDVAYIPELVGLIFQYLDVRSQIRMKIVCKLWYNICEDELLWKFKYMDSWTIYDGDSNYKKDTSVVKFRNAMVIDDTEVIREDSADEYSTWMDLCVKCTLNEQRHREEGGSLSLTNQDDGSGGDDNYNRLYSCRISRDGQFVVSGGQSSSISILKMKDVLDNHREFVVENERPNRLSLQELFTGRRRVTETKKVKRERIKIHSVVNTSDVGWTISDIDFSYDSSLMSYSTWNNYIPVMRVDDPRKRIEIPLTDDDDGRYCAFSLRYSSTGKEILTGCSDGTLYCCDIPSGKVSCQVYSSSEDLNAVSYGGADYPDIMFTGGDDCCPKIWDKRDFKKPVGVLIGHKYGIASVSAKGDGIHYLSSSKDQTIKLWDVRKLSGSDLGILKLKSVQDSLNPMNWDYRYPEMIPPTSMQTKSEFDKSIMTYYGHHQLFKTLIRADFSPAFSTGQKYIYCGSVDGSVVLYEVATGKLAHKVKASDSLIREVAWHPYLPVLCCASWDTQMKAISYTGKLGNIKFVQK